MLEAVDVDVVNEWAKRQELRDKLAEWTVRGLAIAPDVATELIIAYEPREYPRTATVTVIQDGFLDDSIRGTRVVLEFERKPCSECLDGGLWTLVSLEATQRCRRGRGQQDWAKGLCS